VSEREIKLKITTDASGAVTGVNTFSSRIKALEKDFSSVGSHLDSFASKFLNMNSLMATGIASMAVLSLGSIAFIKSTADAYGEQELAEHKLTAVLAAHGVKNKEITKTYADYAAQIQETTVYSDEAVLSMMRIMTAMGTMPSQIKPATEAALSLADVFGIDLDKAARTVTQAMEGNSRSLGMLIPAFKGAEKGAMSASQVLKVITDHVGNVAQREVTTYAGKVKQLENSWGEFKETFGSKVVPVLKEALDISTKLIKSLSQPFTSKENQDKTAQQWIDKATESKIAVLQKLQTENPSAFSDQDKRQLDQLLEYQKDINLRRAEDERDTAAKLIKANNDFIKTKSLAEESSKILSSVKELNKKIYESEVESADHEKKMRQLNYENELNFYGEIINRKETALNKWYEGTAAAIDKYVHDEKTKNSELETLYSDYSKQWQKYEDVRAERAVESIEFQKQAMSSYVTWEKKQADDLTEYWRTQGGRRSEISADLWDKISQYEKMTGTKLSPDQRNEIDVNALIEEYWGMSSELADFYSTINGYEDAYRQNIFNWIDKEEKRRAALYDDDVAAAKWAADEKGKLETELYKKKTDYLAAGFGELRNSFEDLADIYAQGSSEANRWTAAANTMESAQKGVAVANAVATIANQGLGDPYTAFYRISAMTAAMISLLATIDESVNGGTSSPTSYSTTTSNSTALGSTEGSQSVNNSLEMLQDTYDMEYRELSGIYEEMKDLNDNITGLVTSIVQYGGVSQFVSLSESSYTGIASFYEKLWGGLSSSLGSFFGGIASSLFGGKTSYELTESGISIYGKSIADLIAGASVYGEYYNTVKKTTSGGLFGKDKTSYQTYYEAMSGDTTAMFTLVYKNLGETLVSIAAGLGADMQETLNYTFSGFTLNLKDMTTDEISEAISSAISTIGDTAVSALFGDILKQYQQLNEGLLETAVRILQDKSVIEYWLDKTNAAFEGTTTEAIAFSEALIDIAGSLEDLTDAMETYYDKFFTDAEKEEKLRSDLTGSLESYGFELPDTRSQYRALVESLDLTTTAGQAAYVAMMQLAESADQYYSYLEDLASSTSESSYATRLDYLRAISGYAEGGISTGPESGYLAQLHGTELVVSPRNGYPATVIGADNPELLAEIKALREVIEIGNLSTAKYNLKFSRILELFELEMKTEGLLMRTS
jgi:hypothetical protein